MSLLSFLTRLIILLTVIGGYKFATRFYRDDPLFGLVFGLVLGVGMLAAMPVILSGLGLFVILSPVAYAVRRYRQSNTVSVLGPGLEVASSLRAWLVAGWERLQAWALNWSAMLRELLQGTDLWRSPVQREATSQSHGENHLVTCVRCDAPVVFADSVSECPECGFVLTIPEEGLR